MPEALLAVPPLQMSTGNSSENDTTAATSDDVSVRSSPSQYSRRSKMAHTNRILRSNGGGQNRNKGRKCQKDGNRPQKKLSLKASSCQQKNTVAVLKLKSRIPRPFLLSPSSSSTSLTNGSSFRLPILSSVDSSVTTKEQTITTVLQRQKTGIIFTYHQRKSISQMDIKQLRRSAQFSHSSKDSKTLVSTNNCIEPEISFSHNGSSFVHKMYNYGNIGYGIGPERDSRMAGMKIFATIMLNAWRKRRDEVKRLLEEIAEFKRGAIKAKNQLHVLNSLFRVEQKRNDELNCQLKRSLEDINTTKSSCESLTTSLISFQADKALLEQQLQTKEQEFESLNALLSQTKSELFKSMASLRELQANLSAGQRKVQTLENQKNELINEIYELSMESKQNEEALLVELRTKNDEIRNLEEQVSFLTGCRQQESSESLDKLCSMQKDVEILEAQVRNLQKCLDETLSNRLKSCLHNCMAFSWATLQTLHGFAFLVLPAMPPPKPQMLPFGLKLDKLLSIVKR